MIYDLFKMDNPGTSINFDAHAFYIEEENEREFEDNQQQNELKELLTNAFDDILDMDDDDDDDEDSSSSDFSLYGNNNKKMILNTKAALTTTKTTTINNNNNNGMKTYQQQQKVVYQQQYSTPAVNQQPPPLQLNMNDQTINYEHHFIKEDEEDEEQPRELKHPMPQLDQQLNHDEKQTKKQDMNHLHIGNDHHLNQNDEVDIGDEEEDDDIDETNKFHFGNGLQLELNQQQLQTPKNPNYNINSNGLEMNNGGAGGVDIDEDNFDDLNINQFEFMNIDSINRQYGRLQLLYKVRGKKLEEVTNRFEAYKEDVNRELRAMKHRVNLADKEKEQAKLSLEQSNQLCQQYQMDIQILNEQNKETKCNLEKLKELNEGLHQKLQETNDEIESLNYQLEQQQNLDSIERLKIQNEQIIAQMHEKYEHEIFLLKENLNKNELELNEKQQLCELLRVQLDQSLKQSDQALIERGDTINRLNKRLLELQKQYDDLLVLRNLNSNEVSQTNMKLYEKITYLENTNQDREKYFQQLQDRNNDLEEQVKLFEAMQLINATSHDSIDHSTSTQSANESIITLKKELERSLNLLKVKRNDIQKYQNEIQKLKEQAKTSSPGVNLNASQKHVIDELNKEKNYLQSDLNELKLKLEESYQQTDHVNQQKQELENELYLKNEQIEIFSNELKKLKEESNPTFIHDKIKFEFNNEKLQLINKYEISIQSLKLDLDNSNSEVIKLKQLYVDVCNEKNDMEDKIRISHDKEIKQVKLDCDLKVKKMEEKYSNLEKSHESEMINFKNENDNKYQALKLIENQLTTEINELKGERKKLECNYKAEIDGLIKEKFSLIEKCSNLEKESKLASEVDGLNFKIKTYESQIENYKNEKFNLIERISILEREAEKVKKLPQYENEVDTLNKKIKNLELDVTKLETEKLLLSDKLTTIEKERDTYRQLSSNQDEKEALRQRISEYEATIDETNKNYLNEKMALIKAENEKYQNLENEFKQSKNENLKIVQKFDNLKVDYDNLNAKYKNEYNQLKNHNDEVNKKFSRELENKLNEVCRIILFNKR